MFLVATHKQLLRNPKNPKEGFMTNEYIRVDKKLKNKDYTEASIILDVAQQKVLKNRFSEREFPELYAYFISHYGDQINQWINDQIKKESNSS